MRLDALPGPPLRYKVLSDASDTAPGFFRLRLTRFVSFLISFDAFPGIL
jgi:hypothetical protein